MQHQRDDGILDILVLGPMGKGNSLGAQNCLMIKKALEILLAEPILDENLKKAGFQQFTVTAPEQLQGNRIANEVFRQLDNADLVIIDMSSRSKTKQPSPNVMYELALVHAMGLPFMLISSSVDPVPFYIAHDRIHHANYANVDDIRSELRQSFISFLDNNSNQNFADNVVSSFYDGAAVIDISAAAGLAAGYYDNFVSRVLREGNRYLARSNGQFTNLLTVLPEDLNGTVQQQLEIIASQIKAAGFALEFSELKTAESDIRGLAVKHVGNVLVDIPSTVYALRRSPRLLKHLQQTQRNEGESIAEIKIHQRLLRQFKDSLQDQLRRDQKNFQIRNKSYDCITVSGLQKKLMDLLRK